MTSETSDLKSKNWAWVSIKNPTYPAEGAGNQTFSFYTLLGAVLGGPLFLVIYFRLSLWFYLFLFPLGLPIFAGYFFLASKYATPHNNKVKLPGKKIEEYISIKDSSLAAYSGRNKIPMELFFESYFDGKIDLCGDALDILEARHDWASFEFTMGQFKFFLTQWIPETLIHSKKQDE